MKKLVFAILVLAVVFGFASCGNGTTGGETLIGRWYAGTDNGSYLEFLRDGMFNNYHAPTDSMTVGEYTDTMDGEIYVVEITNIYWAHVGPESTTLRCTIDGKWLMINRDSTGWDVNSFIGGWHR